MKELITEVASASINTTIPTTTAEVAAQYETKLNQSIAIKNLIAVRDSKPPIFTKEELSYLRKAAEEDGPMAEVKVITPDPTITLKKGKTEINIRNAATLVKKMEEIYPSPNRSIMPDTDGSDVTESEIDEIIQELEDEVEREEVTNEPAKIQTPLGEAKMKISKTPGMKDRFQKLVNHPSSQVSPEVARCVAPDEETFKAQFIPAPPATETLKTVNKNAYEIRTDVLCMALDWVKYKADANNLKSLNDDDVLTAAQKFYKFVENRR